MPKLKNKALHFYSTSRLAISKAFLWLLVLAIIGMGLLSLLVAPNVLDPLRYQALIEAKVISVHMVSSDVLNPSRKVVFRLSNGDVQWGLGQGYKVDDRAQVIVYQRILTRREEYRLLQPIASRP